MKDNTAQNTQALIDRARKGDRDAYDSLFEQAAARLLLYVRLRLGGELRHAVESQDVMQEKTLKPLRGRRRSRPSGGLDRERRSATRPAPPRPARAATARQTPPQESLLKPESQPAQPSRSKVVIRLARGTKGFYEGDPVSAEDDTVLVAFPRSDRPLLPIAEDVRLACVGGQLRSPLLLQTRVVFHSEDEQRCLYRFRASSELEDALVALFSRRKTFRIGPDPSFPVKIGLRVAGCDREIQATMKDLSRGGVGALISRDDEEPLLGHSRVGIEIRLAGVHPPLRYEGETKFRQLTGAAVHYGLQFVGAGPGAAEDQGRKLSDYLMQRRREILDEATRGGAGQAS